MFRKSDSFTCGLPKCGPDRAKLPEIQQSVGLSREKEWNLDISCPAGLKNAKALQSNVHGVKPQGGMDYMGDRG